MCKYNHYRSPRERYSNGRWQQLFPLFIMTFGLREREREASLTWVKVFKRKHRIKQRKITKYVTNRDIATLEETMQAAEQFRKQTSFLIPKFNLDLVINTDPPNGLSISDNL